MTDATLQQARDDIDQLDQQILTLLNQRATIAQQVGQIKHQADPNAVLYRPEREAQVLRRLQTNNAGPLGKTAVKTIFREVMSACLALEQPQTVAFLGPIGTYTEQAVRKQFGQAVQTQPYTEIADIFQAVETGAVEYGMVPIENSAEGMVGHTLDCLMQTSVLICGEQTLRIQHQLLGQVSSLEHVKTVYAHPQALAQCRHWLGQHLPQATYMPVSSNGEAARIAAETSGAVAIASCQAAEHYQLATLAAHIEDEADNSTRFIVLGRSKLEPSGRDKTSLLLSAQNQPGGLYQLLAPLAEHQIDMSRIESRPSRRGKWDYVFFIDLLGHQSDADVQQALAALDQQGCPPQILGSYPRAV